MSTDEVVSIKELVDMDALLDRVGGDEEFIEELFEIFLEDSQDLLDQIKSAVSENDSDGIARIAHKLKGSVSNFVSTGPIFESAKVMEALGKNEQTGEFPAAYETLASQIGLLRDSMQAYGG